VHELLRGAGLAELRKHSRDAVVMRVGIQVGHGVDRERDIEPEFMGLPRGGLDAGAGGDADHDDLRDVGLPEIFLEVGAGEGAPRPLGDDMIGRLPVEFGKEFGPAWGKRAARARPLGAARRSAVDIDENDRQLARAKGSASTTAF
jgi:hypothetical protein